MDAARRTGDKIRICLTSFYFDNRYKKHVHIAQLLFIILIISLTIARIATKPKGVPTTRSDTIGIVMGVKSLIVLAYQLTTTHIYKFKRWASQKAYVVLNCLEIPFWLVVIIITFMGISRFCQGTSCALSWIVVLIAALLEYVYPSIEVSSRLIIDAL